MSELTEFKCIVIRNNYFDSSTGWGAWTFTTKTNIKGTMLITKYSYFDKNKKENDDKKPKIYQGRLSGTIGELTINQEYIVTAKYNTRKKDDHIYAFYEVSQIAPVLENINDKNKFLSNMVTKRQYKNIISVYDDFVDRILENKEIDISKIKGVGEKIFAQIEDKIKTNYWRAEILNWLAPLGITDWMMKKIQGYEKDPIKLKQLIISNPYILTTISGLGFSRVDQMVKNLYPENLDTIYRAHSYINEYLTNMGNLYGHTVVEVNKVIAEAKKVIPENTKIEECLTDEDKYRSFKEGELTYIGKKSFYDKEKAILERLREINSFSDSIYHKEKSFEEISKLTGLEVDDDFAQAIKMFRENNILLINGYAGTGKTSCVKMLLCDYDNTSICQSALANKAAVRLADVTGHKAASIHKNLGYNKYGYKYNESNPMPYNLYVLDEGCMVNISMFYRFVMALPDSCKVIIVGDVAQLRSIGAGSVFRDLLTSDLPKITLETIRRQTHGSGIIKDANMIRKGINPLGDNVRSDIRHGENNDSCYRFFKKKIDIFNHAVKSFLSAAEKYTVDKVYIITPMRERGINNTHRFNEIIQDNLLGNRKFLQTKQRKMYEGARIILRKGSVDKQTINGDIGYIVEIKEIESDIGDKQEIAIVDFGNKFVEFTKQELFSESELAYAITVHKFQGSQEDYILTVYDWSHYIMLNRENLYTSITRPIKLHYFIGERKALLYAIKTKSNVNTFLSRLAKGTINIFISL